MSDQLAEKLVGKVLASIDIDQEENQILLTTVDGERYLIHHNQDCCESVTIESTEGEWASILGKPLLMVDSKAIKEGPPSPESNDSWTRTAITFRVDGATVISRWIGESNGYYSEDVDFKELGRMT